MEPEFEIEIGGQTVRFVVPIGAVDEISKINNHLDEIADSVLSGKAEWGALCKMAGILIRHSNANITVEEIYNSTGWTGIKALVLQALSAAWTGVTPQDGADQGEAGAAPTPST